jgi:hypothetical protein
MYEATIEAAIAARVERTEEARAARAGTIPVEALGRAAL